MRSAANVTMSRIRWRRSIETNRSNFGQKITSRYSSSTSCDRIRRLGSLIARSTALLEYYRPSGQRRQTSMRQERRSPFALGPPGCQLCINLIIGEAAGACLALEVSDGFREHVVQPAAFEQFTEIPTKGLSASRIIEEAGGLRSDGDHHFDRFFHCALRRTAATQIAMRRCFCEPRSTPS